MVAAAGLTIFLLAIGDRNTDGSWAGFATLDFAGSLTCLKGLHGGIGGCHGVNAGIFALLHLFGIFGGINRLLR